MNYHRKHAEVEILKMLNRREMTEENEGTPQDVLVETIQSKEEKECWKKVNRASGTCGIISEALTHGQMVSQKERTERMGLKKYLK